MALDYANFELVQNIKRNLKGTAPKEKLSEIGDKIQITLPINSANAPINVRESYSDFDSSPQNYLSISQTNSAALANTTWTSFANLAVPTGSYIFVHGWTMACEDIIADSAIEAMLCTGDATTLNSAYVIDAGTDYHPHGSTVAKFGVVGKFFTRPVMIATGYVRIRAYQNTGGTPAACGRIYYEVRKIENRDP